MIVPLRWEDVDGLGHVGHVAVLRLLEEGRDDRLAQAGIGRDAYVVGRSEVTYRREILLEGRAVDVRCTVTRVGRSSLDTSEEVSDGDGSVCVSAAFGLVLWDAERRTPRPVTDAEREALT